jgi:hypothetical protein
LAGKDKESENILQKIVEIKEREPEIFRIYEKYLDPVSPIFSDFLQTNAMRIK